MDGWPPWNRVPAPPVPNKFTGEATPGDLFFSRLGGAAGPTPLFALRAPIDLEAGFVGGWQVVESVRIDELTPMRGSRLKFPHGIDGILKRLIS